MTVSTTAVTSGPGTVTDTAGASLRSASVLVFSRRALPEIATRCDFGVPAGCPGGSRPPDAGGRHRLMTRARCLTVTTKTRQPLSVVIGDGLLVQGNERRHVRRRRSRGHGPSASLRNQSADLGGNLQATVSTRVTRVGTFRFGSTMIDGRIVKNEPIKRYSPQGTPWTARRCSSGSTTADSAWNARTRRWSIKTFNDQVGRDDRARRERRQGREHGDGSSVLIDASIGDRTTIGTESWVASGARVGDDARSDDRTTIGANAVVEDNCHVVAQTRSGHGTLDPGQTAQQGVHQRSRQARGSARARRSEKKQGERCSSAACWCRNRRQCHVLQVCGRLHGEALFRATAISEPRKNAKRCSCTGRPPSEAG